MSRFKIGGTIYEGGSPEDVTLADLLRLQSETEELGKSINMGEIVRLAELFESLTPTEARTHPDSGWMLGITVWLAMVKRRRDLGDLTPVPWVEAIGFSMGDFTPLKDASDHNPPKKAAPRKGSAQGGGRGGAGTAGTAKTSPTRTRSARASTGS